MERIELHRAALEPGLCTGEPNGWLEGASRSSGARAGLVHMICPIGQREDVISRSTSTQLHKPRRSNTSQTRLSFPTSMDASSMSR